MRRFAFLAPLVLVVLAACGGADPAPGGTTATATAAAGEGRAAFRDPSECGPLPELPPSDDWLTCVTAASIERGAPWWDVRILAPRELRLAANGRDSFEVYLDNLAGRVALARTSDEVAASVEEFVERIVASIDETRMEPGLESIRAILKPRGWAAETSRQIDAADPLVTAPFLADIEVVFVIDLPTSMRLLAESDLARLGIERGELATLARRNMEAALTTLPFERHPDEDALFVLAAGDAYDASRLLLPALWAEARSRVRGELLVAAPSRDVVFFTGSETPGGPEALRAWAERVVAQDGYPVSSAVLVWTEAGFVARGPEPAPPASGAALRP